MCTIRRLRSAWIKLFLIAGAASSSLLAQVPVQEQCLLDGQALSDPVPSAMAGRSGIVRCFRASDQRRLREYEFSSGRLLRQTDWNDLGQRVDVHFHANGATKTRARQVSFDGKPAWDREEFWDSGLLRLRGTYLEGGGAQGLIQSFDSKGPLARELWYEQGRLVRRKGFDLDGQTVLDEEFLPDGQIKTQLQRYQQDR